MSDTPRTDAEWTDDYYCSGYVPTEFARQLERELAEAQAEIARLKGEAESLEKVFDRTCEHLAEAKEELNDRRKFAYAVEQALDGVKGDYVEIIVALRKDAERYRWMRERHENTIMDIYNSISPAMIKPELLDAAVDAEMKEGGK